MLYKYFDPLIDRQVPSFSGGLSLFRWSLLPYAYTFTMARGPVCIVDPHTTLPASDQPTNTRPPCFAGASWITNASLALVWSLDLAVGRSVFPCVPIVPPPKIFRLR